MRRERLAMRTRFAPLIALALIVCGFGLSVTGSGDAASVNARRCSPEGYGLEQHALPRGNQHQEAVRLTAGWLTGTEGRRICALRTTIRVEIRHSGRVEASARWRVRTVLNPWSATVHTWVWRNWCPHGPGEATVTFSLPNGTKVRQRVSDPPTCVDRSAPTTLADLGTGTKYVSSHGDRIPPHFLPPGTPPPLQRELIDPVNAWLVSDGYSLVAVYAGSPGIDPSLGRFAIIRQNLIFGVQYDPPDFVDIPAAGALKITAAPQGAASETSAQRGKLTFMSENGTTGVLDLRRDRVRIISSG